VTRVTWVLAAVTLIGGMAALHLGFTLEWDRLNYHLYNPHALLTGRLAIDVAAAQQQTYLNPALYLPLYAVFKYLGPAALVFVLGVLQAAQLFLLVALLEELTGRRIDDPWWLALIAVLGLGGPIFLSQLGSTNADTLLSALVLAGLLVILRAVNRPEESALFKTGLISGLLLGLACALKLTMAIYAVGMAIALLLWFKGSGRWQVLSGLTAGGLAGVLLAGGAWFYHLWQMYGNPVFPYFNDIFGSPWIAESSYRDMRFIPRSLFEWLFYPVAWLIDPLQVWEYPFRDIRVPLLIGLVFVLPLLAWKRLRQDFPALGLTCVFLAASYILWLRFFSIYRYLSVLEMLAPLVIFSTALLWVHSRRILLGLLAVLISTQALVHYQRGFASWDFRADTPTRLSDLPEDAMVIIADNLPSAYAALWMAEEIPLVRIRANFFLTIQPVIRLHEWAHNRVRDHQGSYYLLIHGSFEKETRMKADLEYAGLALPAPESCEEVFYSEDLQRQLQLKLCALQDPVR
jgi:hypothetical protein